MKRIADSLCVVDSRTIDEKAYEVCASTTTDYEEDTNEATIRLDCFVRQVNARGADRLWQPGWLPRAQVLRHRLSEDEASDDAREVFQDWRHTVKAAIPSTAEFAGSLNDANASGEPQFRMAET